MTKALLLTGALFGLSAAAFADPILQGTRIDVRSNQTIDVRAVDNGRIYTGTVVNDVVDADGRIKIPRGSQAELIVRRTGPNNLSIDLDGITVEGRHYSVDSRPTERTRDEASGNNANVGDNRRTGEYVGGGALLGSVIGAIAGGGKGAAIGALAGAGAGAGTEVMTHGEAVHIPAESILSFRLDRPLDVFADRGVDRDGYHYHQDSYYDYDRR